MKISVLRLMPLFLFGVLALFFWGALSLDPHQIPTTKKGNTLPSFDLPSLLTSEVRFRPVLFQNHPTLLVVWASWCETCAEEQPFLMELARQGFYLYGLNYKDDPNLAKKWLLEFGNPFQEIGLDRKGKLALDLGVYGTPEIYLLDAQGVILTRFAGQLTPAIWRKEFLPLLRRL